VMNEGIIQQIGTVDELWNQPINKFVAGFLGEPAMNFFVGKIETPQEISISIKDGKFFLWLEKEIENKHVGSEVTVGIRPEKIVPHPNKKEKSIPSMLEVIEPLGESKILTVKLNGNEFKVVTSLDIKAHTGQVIWLEFNREDIHVFHKETENTLIKKLCGNG